MARTLLQTLAVTPSILVEVYEGGASHTLLPEGNDVLYPLSVVVPCIRGTGYKHDPYYTTGIRGSDHLKIVTLWWELRILFGQVWIRAGDYWFEINQRGVRSEDGLYARLG